MRAPPIFCHSRSSRGSGPARCVWPKITWDAGTCRRVTTSLNPASAAAAERDPGHVGSQRADPARFSPATGRRQAGRHRAAADAPPAGAAVQRCQAGDRKLPRAWPRCRPPLWATVSATRTSARAPPRSPRRGPDRPRARRRPRTVSPGAEPFEDRHGVVAVAVVTVGRVDVLAQPHPWIGDPDACRRERGHEGAERLPLVPLDWGLETERRGIAPLEPAAQQRMVVVAGYHDDLADDGGELA